MPQLVVRVNLYAVGRIVGCFGIKGFLKLQPTTHRLQRFEKLKDVFLGRSTDDTERFTVEALEVRTNGIVVRFKAVGDRSAAEALIGKIVFVEEHEVLPPEEGSYFAHDVVGCEVWTIEGRFIGTVQEIFKLPAQDLWEVRNGSDVHLIPAVKEFIRHVDLQRRRIDVHLIEGLIDG